jgi:(4S)-4-hydroxy-5-phosphonooxypentane-2,3-dione isomerase
MLVITVRFNVKRAHLKSFSTCVRRRARDTLAIEKDCCRLEICSGPENVEQIFLHEIYTDDAAFQARLISPHFLQFKSDTQDWLESSVVGRWDGPWD